MRRIYNKEDLCYERMFICTYDLLTSSKSPRLTLDALMKKHNFKLKDTVPISYHLGCDFTRDGRNELLLYPHKHIDKMSDSHTLNFDSKSK